MPSFEKIAITTRADDLWWMENARRVAMRGLGTTAANPSVGAVLVRNGILLARGWTQPGGRPHAETHAISQAPGVVAGATLYVTLEPCAHHGRTGPCTNAIIEAGISRVVFAVADPNPLVEGRGIAALRAARVTVEQLDPRHRTAREILWSLAGHLSFVCDGRPLFQAKVAMSADGRIPRGDAGPVWVTGETARRHAHLLRARCDAIVIGRGTLEVDDPALDCRLPGMSAHSPHRYVVAPPRFAAGRHRVVTDRDRVPTTFLSAEPASAQSSSDAPAADAAKVISMARTPRGSPSLKLTFAQLAQERSIRRVLFEGGAGLLQTLVEIDEWWVYVGQGRIGSNGLTPPANCPHGPGHAALGYELAAVIDLGGDRLFNYRRISRALAFKALASGAIMAAPHGGAAAQFDADLGADACSPAL